MEGDYSFGKMENFIQVIGQMIKEKERAQIIILMEMFIKDHIKMEKKMDQELINGKMEMNIKEIGKMI